MRYLVTGGAGFIGSHIVDALIEKGHDVVVLDNLSSGYTKNLFRVLDKVPFIEGDIRDPEACLKAAEGCNGIFHEAALVSVPDSINRPRDNHDVNITGTLNVLEAARQQGVKRVVFASSAAVYGDNPVLPKKEDMLPEPKSPYALAKITGENYLRVYAECYRLETVALRYFNVFGPRQDPSSMYSGVISVFSERIKKGLPITVYGDGKQTRDFVNVADVVQANLLAMTTNSLRTMAESQKAGVKPFHQPVSHNFVALNVAAGRQTSLLGLLNTLENLTNNKATLNFSESRSGDIRHSLADISKAREILGFDPQVELEEGLHQLVAQTCMSVNEQPAGI